MTDPATMTRTPARRRASGPTPASDWGDFEARLAAALSRLPARQYLVLSAEGPASCSYYVQFALGHRGLPGSRTLDALVITQNEVRAFEIDGAGFVHRGDIKKAEDRLADFAMGSRHRAELPALRTITSVAKSLGAVTLDVM